ncbi:MAG TPA: sulfite exporter TauE/SafE family protein [Holophagaceae bacterium]|nr:sulfite exporter TauE/SafE family protein [Holophagaceae bacterium]
MNPLLGGILCGAAGGLLSGAFGIGGGIVLVPLLGLLLGLDQAGAQGMALAAMLLPNGLPAVWHYHRQGVTVDHRLVLAMLPGFLLGVTGGAFAANAIPLLALRLVFVAFLFAMAWKIGFQGGSGAGREARDWRLMDALLVGAAGGLASGLLGIGGGVVIIPLLAWRLGYAQHRAQVTSLALMLPPIGLPGVWVYAKAHPHGLPWMALGGVALGFAAAAMLGARWATATQGPRLRRAFAVLLGAMGLLLLRNAFRA